MRVPKQITIDPEVMGGAPCIRGMRICVSDVLEMLQGGMTYAEILRDYPYLKRSDISACLQYAKLLVDTQTAGSKPSLVAAKR